MTEMNIEKITVALENVALAVNKAVESMNRVESKREVIKSTDQVNEKVAHSKETGGKSESVKAQEKGGMGTILGAVGAVGAVGATGLGYAAHASGLTDVVSSKLDNFFGGSVREGAMKDMQGYLEAGVRPSDEDMETIVAMQKRQNDLKTETIERLYKKTQPDSLKPVAQAVTEAINLPGAFIQEEGFRNQVMNNFGAVASDTYSRIGDLLSGKLSFSDYIRGF